MKFEKPEIFIRVFKQEKILTQSGMTTNIEKAKEELLGANSLTVVSYTDLLKLKQ